MPGPKPKHSVRIEYKDETYTAAVRNVNGVWQADLRSYGGGRRSYGSDRPAAEAAVREDLLAIAKSGGSAVTAGIAPAPAPVTLQQLVKDYQEYLADRGKSEQYVKRKAAYITTAFAALQQGAGRKPMGQYTARDATLMIDALPKLLLAQADERRRSGAPHPPTARSSAKRASGTLRHYVQAIHGFWRWVIGRYDFVAANPFARHAETPSAKPANPNSPLPVDKAADLEAWCIAHAADPQCGNRWLPVILLTMLYSGARPSEALNLRVGDLRLRDGLLHIEGSKTKGSVRDVLLWPRLATALSWHVARLADQSRDAYLFPNSAGGACDNVRAGWSEMRRLFGLGPGNQQVYCLRGTFASACLRVERRTNESWVSVQPGEMSAWLGHSNPATLVHYLKPMPHAVPVRGELDYQRLAGRPSIPMPGPQD